MKEKIELLKSLLRDEKRILYVLIGLYCIGVFMGFILGVVSKGNPAPEKIVEYDTVWTEKSIPPASVPVEKVVIVKPIPALTAYNVTDWVCAWGKWSGVVIGIAWSEKNPTVLLYEVQHYNETEESWVEQTYFDTELTPGKCN